MAEWTNLFAMIEDIHAHVRETKREVEVDDNPHRLRFGFRDPMTDERWEMRLTSVKASFFEETMDHRNADVATYRSLMATTEGRRRLANLPLTPL